MPPIHYTAVSLCHSYGCCQPLGLLCRYRAGKLVKATKLAEKNLDRVGKYQKLNVSPSRMNLEVKEEDIQDEGMLVNWDHVSSREDIRLKQ